MHERQGRPGLGARAIVSVLAAMTVVAGCSVLGDLGVGGASSDYDIHVENGTTLDVAVVVNERKVASASAGGFQVVPASGLVRPPWDIALVTSSGRTIAELHVAAGSVGCEDGPDGSRACSGAVTLEDLSCGRVVLWVTPTPPEIPPPMPGGGKPGDCEP
ncbi:MAG TPA: hypothetical protein VES19_17440 [Candidatus Limnocylindrales bacterium]|nr:hypothetical protein [Candidatus Limnocylindrales bacterium]